MGIYGRGNLMIRVLVWAENRPDPEIMEKVKEIYPNGIEGTIAEFLKTDKEMRVSTATMNDADQGLSDEVLEDTDVLIYWSHKHWREITDDRVQALWERVLDGMGLIVLHAAHASRIFSRLMGTRTQSLRWRENDERQRYWIVFPGHPISEGLDGEYFDIPQDETYGEYFEIPQPEQQIFLTNSEGGEIMPSGCCWTRGQGKIFYFSGGHETYPVYHQKEVQQVISNAVHWACHSRKMPSFPKWARHAEDPHGGAVILHNN